MTDDIIWRWTMEPRKIEDIEYIILHHSATPSRLNDEDVSGEKLAKVICKRAREHYKEDAKHGYMCDYHFIVGPTGKIFKGQPIELPAWNCGNYRINLVSIAVCALGNFEKIKMPKAQEESIIKLVRKLKDEFNIPIENILPHREIVNTECPGKNYPLDDIIKEVAKMPLTDEEKFMLKNEIFRPGSLAPDYLEKYFSEKPTKKELAIFLYRVIEYLEKKNQLKVTGGGSNKNYSL